MNRSKRMMSNKLRKKMGKEIRLAQARYPAPESLQYSDELTAKEMLKKYPKRVAKKIEATVKGTEKRIEIKKLKHQKMSSKRTAPGGVPADSSPSNAHKEGRRWIKTLIKQNLTQRAIQTHKGGRKK
jgi:hypothetical protein